jgi:hypothetical protein
MVAFLYKVQLAGERIRIKELKYFNPKKPLKWFLSPRKYETGCSSRIRILTFYPSRIPDLGIKKAPDPGSGSATLFVRDVKIIFLLYLIMIFCIRYNGLVNAKAVGISADEYVTKSDNVLLVYFCSEWLLFCVRYNGLVNAKAVGISAGPDNKGFVLTTKRSKVNKYLLIYENIFY